MDSPHFGVPAGKITGISRKGYFPCQSSDAGLHPSLSAKNAKVGLQISPCKYFCKARA